MSSRKEKVHVGRGRSHGVKGTAKISRQRKKLGGAILANSMLLIRLK
jgi:hypothetical protein